MQLNYPFLLILSSYNHRWLRYSSAYLTNNTIQTSYRESRQNALENRQFKLEFGCKFMRTFTRILLVTVVSLSLLTLNWIYHSNLLLVVSYFARDHLRSKRWRLTHFQNWSRLHFCCHGNITSIRGLPVTGTRSSGMRNWPYHDHQKVLLCV